MAHDSAESSYLYDFLYVDKPRLSSYSAQLFADGVLTGAKTLLQEGNSEKIDVGATAAVIKGNFSDNSSLLESIERQYDANWSLPLNVIEKLHEDDYINSQVDGTPTGCIIRLKGNLALLDIKLLKQMWIPLTKWMFEEMKTTHANKKDIEMQKKSLDNCGGLLDKLPSNVQIYLQTPDHNLFWSALSEEHLIVNPDDLGLKYGSFIDGEWNIIGVIDARPDSSDQPKPFEIPGDLFNGVMGIMDEIRKVAGRPHQAYGITPLVIYRAVTRHG